MKFEWLTMFLKLNLADYYSDSFDYSLLSWMILIRKYNGTYDIEIKEFDVMVKFYYT